MTASRIAIIGSNGLLGQNFVKALAEETTAQLFLADIHSQSFIPDNNPTDNTIPSASHLAYTSVDITSRAAVKEFALQYLPEIILNCAAINDVDACEVERERAWKINVKGVEHLADGCRTVDARLIHFSSDYVFDGKHGPYCERDKPNPICYYGKTKLASENACRMGGIRFIVVRTSVLYGMGTGIRTNFVQWVVDALSSGKDINVVTDQTGNPTPADQLAAAVLRLIDRQREGLYHIAGPDIISRYDCALRIAEVFDLDANKIHPVTTEMLRQSAPRPLNAGLITLKAESESGARLSKLVDGLQILKRRMDLAHSLRQVN